jgi:hypothetical protein
VDVLSDITRTSGAATVAKPLLAALSGSIIDGATSPMGVLGEIRFGSSLVDAFIWDGTYWRKITMSAQPASTLGLYDFGTDSTALYAGAIRVTPSTVYNGTTINGGFAVSSGIAAADRDPGSYTVASPQNFYRDIIYNFGNLPNFKFKTSSAVNVRVHVYDAYAAPPGVQIGATGKTSVTVTGGTGNTPTKVDFTSVSPAGGNDFIEVSMGLNGGSFCCISGIEIAAVGGSFLI